jgi:hypothetical protein
MNDNRNSLIFGAILAFIASAINALTPLNILREQGLCWQTLNVTYFGKGHPQTVWTGLLGTLMFGMVGFLALALAFRKQRSEQQTAQR